MGKEDRNCGNKTGQNLLVTGDKVKMTFTSDEEIERRGYYLVFTLVLQASVSPPSSLPYGKWLLSSCTKFIFLLKLVPTFYFQV